jgi:serine protease Do
MHPATPQDRAGRPARWRKALLPGLAVMAVAGGVLLAQPHQRVEAQSSFLPNGAPTSFADLVERVKPAVVSIQVTSKAPKVTSAPKGAPYGGPKPGAPYGGDPRGPGWRGGPPGGVPDGLEDFFNKRYGFDSTPRPTQAEGSGFVISPDGYVVTNNHVVAGAGKVQIIFDQHNKYEADVIGTDERTDLALLKIKTKTAKTFPTVKFATSQPRVGDWVVAVGNPFGLGGTVTAGIVSAHGRDIGSGPYDYMQIDAAVNKGNSGGPSFNLQGEVVGVNTAIVSPTGTNAGIAFAIPAKTANDIIEQLKQNGTIKRGWLGVRIQNVDEDVAASLGLSEPKGALVAEVQTPSPAAAAGIKRGDTILAVNGVKVADSRDLSRQIAGFQPDSTVELKVVRAQKEQAVQVKLGLLPSANELSKYSPGRPSRPTELSQLGLSVQPVEGPTREGVQVSEVEPDSPVAAKIRVGDVILEADNRPVNSAEDLIAIIRDANRQNRRAILLLIRSGNETRFEPVPLRRN